MRDVETLKPFTRFLMTIGTLPSSYLVSMTYEEQLLWFCNFLQKEVIPTVNNNAEAVIELQNYVSSYFDNLDVQEEINNKLDEMAESGELAEIIAQYIQLAGVLAYDTVTDLISAENIVEGSICRTLGETTYNDGLGSYYKIRTVTSGDVVDNVNILALDISDTLVAEKIKSILSQATKPNKNFDLKLGTSTLFDTASETGMINALDNMKKYFDSILQTVRLTYNSVTSSFEVADANIDTQIAKIQNYINNGGKLDGIKFHQSGTNLNTLLSTYGSDTICQAYSSFVIDFIDSLSYKSSVDKVFIMNEQITESTSSDYFDDIIACVEAIKTAGYEVSIPFANVSHILAMSDDLLDSLSYISLNEYPLNDYFGKYSSINDVAERFNYDYEVVERKLKNRDLVITEFGCSSSWTSFTTPYNYQQDGNGKPISLIIEGFYKSKFIQKIKGAYLWYYFDAYTFAPSSLLSIKNNTEVRYYGE